MLNWELLKNPLNWVIVLVMLLVAGLAGYYIITFFNQLKTQSQSAQ
jgi:hypothetical protein